MSKKRHSVPRRRTPGRVVVRTYAVRHLNGHQIPPHSHDWHQLIYASEGVMWVHTALGDWVVPPNRAVWMPAGIEHSIDMVGPVLIQTVYLATGICDALPVRCCAVNVSPLLRELVRHAISIGTLDRKVPEQARLIAFLIDQLSVLPTIPLQLPSPTDERACRAAAWLRSHPAEPGLIKQVAKRVGASARTLERLFQNETGMTFGKWRQRPSAFIAMFRRTLGTTPNRYFR
jgi:AraC-like DNA-binding protein